MRIIAICEGGHATVEDHVVVDCEVQVPVIATYTFLHAVMHPVVVPHFCAVGASRQWQGPVHARHECVVGVDARTVQSRQPAIMHVTIGDLVGALAGQDAAFPEPSHSHTGDEVVVAHGAIFQLLQASDPSCFNGLVLPMSRISHRPKCVSEWQIGPQQRKET